MSVRWRSWVVLALALAAPLTTGSATVTEQAEALARSGDRAGAEQLLRARMPELPVTELPHALWLMAGYSTVWDSSRVRCEEILRRFPDTPFAPLALMRLGEGSLLAGELGRAHELFVQAAEQSREPELRQQAWFRSGQALLRLGQPGEARAPLRRVVADADDGPLRDQALLVLSACDFREANYADALRGALDLLDGESGVEPDALLLAGRCLLARGEVPLAVRYLDQLAHEFPGTPDAALARAFVDSVRVRHALPERPVRSEPVTPEGAPTGTTGEPGADPTTPDVDLPPAPDVTAADDPGQPYELLLGRFDARIDAIAVLSRLRRAGVEDATLIREDGDGASQFRVRVSPVMGGALAREEAGRLAELADVEAEIRKVPR